MLPITYLLPVLKYVSPFVSASQLQNDSMDACSCVHTLRKKVGVTLTCAAMQVHSPGVMF